MNTHFFYQHKFLTFVLIVILIPLTINFWYIILPLLGAIYIYQTKKLNQTKKIAGYVSMVVLVVILSILNSHISAYNNRTPVLTITSPENNQTMQGAQIVIKGTVDPIGANITVNGDEISGSNDGTFAYIFKTPDATNTAVIIATNDSKTDNKTLVINRQFTDQEKADMVAQQAKTKADEQAYMNSPAGKLCTKHSDWTPDDCDKVANHKYWIGMNLDMLKAERGNPDHANPSNYGRETSWQWCWFDYTPSCFYGGEDGIITSYN